MSNQDRMHEIVCMVKDLAIDLNKTPTLSDIEKKGISSRHEIIKIFGGNVQLISACGLSPSNKRKIDETIFNKDIKDHIEEFTPTEKIPFLDIKLTHAIWLGDFHAPFSHKDAVKKALDYIEFKKPKRIGQVGDLYDMLSHTKFARSFNTYTPKEEMNEGRKQADNLWKEIRRIAPKAELWQILGNHDIRPMKRILETYPEAELFMDFEKWFKFDGVQTQSDIRQELILDGVAHIHGHKSRLGDHMEFMRRPVVCGHSHRGGVFYKNYGDQTLWELNVGYLGDPSSKALAYTPQKHTHWTWGLGEIDQYGPRFVHF